MTDVATNGDWVLPEQVTLATVAALFRQCAEQPAAIRAFDLSHVQDIDSAGVRSRAIERRLRAVETIPETQATQMIDEASAMQS